MSQRLQAACRAALLAASILLSAGGIAGFVVLFARDFNVYWLILAPIILALYQIPAVFVFWIYKRQKGLRAEKAGPGSPAPPQAADGETREDRPAAPREPQA
jgi:membrane protease YdiL (CAAX protease family)